jgi:hypothetical protein
VSLLFGISYACNLIKESVNCVYIDQIRIHFIAEYLDDLFRFTLSQESMVYMNTYQLLSDRLDQQCGYNRRVYTAG